MNIDLFQVVSSFAVLLLSLSVHETAHAWTANRLGDPTARDLGRISLNPLVHADFFGTFLVPLMGLFTGFILAWAKPVPVNTARLRNPRRDYMLVAAAGPVSNIMMAGGLFVFLFLLGAYSSSMELPALLGGRVILGGALGDTMLAPLASMAYFSLMINLILAIFNLIPVAPLDGAAILSGLLPEVLARPLERIQSFGFVILIGLLYLGIPWYLFNPMIGAVRSVLTY